MTYLWFKAFHIVGIVAWFAGMFYLPRLFVYHAEANEQPEAVRSVLQQQYQIMEKRLYRIIMTPALVLTVAMAIGMVVVAPELLKETWLHVKLGLVLILIGYHHICARLMKEMAAGKFRFTGQQFRWFNEFPTVLFVIVVLLAVFKNNFPTSAASWAVVGMIVAMAAIIQLYARKRRLAREQAAQALDPESTTVAKAG
ncbi:protoporphyrinogen oxidase HemJ [Leptolyngbya sp. NK1-12]|uniref:Protoporphyrinogen IX oxidase n=1 Tax=Leptolyngbya sp. NK1-12 TaxID=2547451 RepID=A0AA96WKL1_9CYAN|nr:protoporphyrinogen oxidase HemJ [Leptolyngbya sp. NK1-12]WNZ23976.1 protoporphyrinogen oxidase HemJ [Leptolyngbya sp. NK1-12]